MHNSIANRLSDGDNGLNAIRLVFAVLVIVSHTPLIGGLGHEPQLGDVRLGALAVFGFFAISGYLISRSRYRLTLGTYTWRRVLRILPGYWVNLIVTAFGFAWILGAIDGGWTARDAIAYVRSGADLYLAGEPIGSTLANVPFALKMNGSLWTLFFELLCYLGIGFALSLSLIRANRITILLGFVLMTAAGILVRSMSLVGPVESATRLIPYFLAGAVLYLYGDVIPMTWRLGVPVLVFGVVAAATPLGIAALPAPVAYLCFLTAITAPRFIRRIGSRNDYSYGMYLYAFPIQQILAALALQNHGFWVFTIVSISATAPFAVASWFLVERPAQRLTRLRLRRRPTHGTAVDGDQVLAP